MQRKNVYIIAGPNGAGKTTFATEFLPKKYAKCANFVNADLIASGLSPFSPRLVAIKAGKLVLEQIRDMANKGVDFAFETTLAGKSHIAFLKRLKEHRWYITIFFLWLPNSELALKRIKDRVAAGGHDVPSADVKRRFNRGLYNFFHYYLPLADSWLLFDSSFAISKPVARWQDDKMVIFDNEVFEKIKTQPR
jgi:predicted ABC-type ATPase